MATDVKTFLEDLDGGVFIEKLSHALSEAAAGAIDHDGDGKVNVTFDLKRISTSHMVQVKHKLSFTRPTMRGKVSEEEATATPMYVGAKGALTFFPEGQEQMFDKKGKVNQKED